MLDRLNGKRVFVTGAGGFIGSHVVEALVRHGAKVKALVLYNSMGSWDWLDQVPANIKDQLEVVAGDIRDGSFISAMVEKCDIVLHLAALISIPFSYIAPASFVDTNVTGTLNILEAARRAGVSRVVCTSTSEVYGTAQQVPIDELHPLRAQSPYAASKVAADQMALAFHRSFGLPVVILRPFNTFGPRQSARAVIPTIITQLANGVREIKLGSLHPTRDFLFVKDTVRGFLHAAVAEGGLGEVVNVGAGFEISIGETASAIVRLMGTNATVVQTQERIRPENSEVERLYAKIEKAGELIGWAPEFAGRSGFERGLSETIEWFKNPANLTPYKFDRYNV